MKNLYEQPTLRKYGTMKQMTLVNSGSSGGGANPKDSSYIGDNSYNPFSGSGDLPGRNSPGEDNTIINDSPVD